MLPFDAMSETFARIEQEQQRIQSFIDKGNYHAAMNLAISAMNACRREHNQQGVDFFINTIQSIVDTVRREFGSTQS